MASAAPFTVSWMPKCREAVAALVQRAIALKATPPLARFLKAIESELRTHPREWGDPIRNHPNLKLVEYAHANAADHFRVFYLVHDTAAVVFVTEIVLIEGNPLRGTNGQQD
jgi:hypothetical protein